ncbi:trehalose-6-phosphate hydrolase [Spiroplasma corruscae]|uniref:Trehalose-6-phosphate hydrolase n=1 Tax=Spiroplasma corruscae TaxID=216934 RepID=A0A222EPI3_9MOLU|nr:alpha,alpha-phosphotrehalase [Spiroplasma corruscae]ASP28427.1 trehalose-6-phosphate hydrolase [Spiroplasma corruscae]
MKNEFIYQIFPQTFCEVGSKRGIGNIKGIISKLDYLKALGITRIWISPLTKSPFKDSGYDVSDYYNINNMFGNMDDFEQLIIESKKRELSIIIDIVFNHTSNQHNWFKKALLGDKKYLNYYIFKDPVNGKEPTNWKSKMGGSVWEYVPKLNKYYLHLFEKSQPDLNWKNEVLRKELINILKFWRDKGVDGFRLDVCNLYSKPKDYKDDEIGDGRRFYTDGEELENYLKYLNYEVFCRDKNIFTVGEVSSTTKEKSFNYAKNNNNELDCIFTFLHLKVDYFNNYKWTYMKPDLLQFWNMQKEWQLYFQENDSNLALFMNNHDQPRAISRFGNDKSYHYESATSIFGFISLMRGIPFIYQGEEIGMTNMHFDNLDDFKDVETIGNAEELKNTINNNDLLNILRSKSRDNARSVMQWSSDKYAGFTEADNINLHINKNYININVDKQKNNTKSVLYFYKKLIDIRTKDPIFVDGKIEFFKEQNFAYKRMLDYREILVLTNWTSCKENIKLKLKLNEWKVVLNNYSSINNKVLEPYQLIVLERI